MQLSIIVPIYNIEEFLPQCINSILGQTLSDFELILIDDGSPDNCPTICDEYAKKDNRIKVVHKSNGGLVSARKAGLEVASGEYIGYVDGDDWVGPTMFEEMVIEAKKHDADIVAAGFTKNIEDNFTTERNIIPSGLYDHNSIQQSIIPSMIFDKKMYAPGIYTYVWNKIFKKDLLEKSQYNVPNDIFLGEDAACTYPAILSAKSIYITDSHHYHYRQRADSMLKISTDSSKDISGIGLLYKYLNKVFKESPFAAKLIPQLQQYILYLLTSRTGGIIDEAESFSSYTYEANIKDANIAIYGAGTLGQHLYRKLNARKYCNIIGWVDPDYMELQKHGLNVNNPESLSMFEFDFILIAIYNENTAMAIRENIASIGIPNEKILTINTKRLDISKIFSTFGIDCQVQK